MENALITVASLTTIIILGVVMPRIIKIPHVFIDILSKIVFNITVPCAIFYAFVTSEFNPSLIMLVGVGFLCCFIPWFVAMLITWREDRDHKVFMMCNISGYNIGNFVLPFAMTMFPSHTIVAICLFDAGNALMTNGGIYPFTSALVEKGTSLKAGETYQYSGKEESYEKYQYTMDYVYTVYPESVAQWAKDVFASV